MVARVDQYPRPVWIEERFSNDAVRSDARLVSQQISVFDEWIIRGDSREELARHGDSLGFAIISEIPDLGLWTIRANALDLTGRAEFERRLALTEGAREVHPNDIIWPAKIPNDPDYGGHWQLKKTNPEPGWSYLTEAAINDRMLVTAAVVDTGVNFASDDILAWVNEGEIAGNGVDDDQNGRIDDVNGYDFYLKSGNVTRSGGHGVNVGRIIGSTGNNGTKNVSAAWRVRLMAGICFSSNGAGSLNAGLESINYAAKNGAQVINCSFIGGSSWAYTYVFSVARDLNVIVVAGAGNNGVSLDQHPLYPVSSTVPNVVGVGASTSSDERASYSNFSSEHLEVFAPASGGTSYAAPMATSVLALLIADDPEAPYERIIKRLIDGSDPVPALAGLSASDGRINLTNSLRLNTLRRPQGLRVHALSASSNRLTWTDRATAETGFIVERSETDPASVRNPDDASQMQWQTVSSNIPVDQYFYDDTGLIPGRTYFYRVRAKGPSFNSARNPETRVTVGGGVAPGVEAPVNPVTALRATGSATSILLRWVDECANEVRFVVERSNDGGQNFYEIAWLDAGTESYEDSEVSEGQSYTYRLKTESVGSGVYSAPVVGTAELNEVEVSLLAPSNFSGHATSPSSVSLSWLDRSEGESAYSVERRLEGGSFATVATLGADSSSYADVGLNPQTIYQYRIRVSGEGASVVSGQVAVTTPALPAVLAVPVLSAAPAGSSSVDLVWESESERHTAFLVQRETGGGWTTVSSVNPTVFGYKDTGLSASQNYRYRIQVTDGVTVKTSNVVSVSTSAQPAVLVAATPSVAAVSPTSITLVWSDQSERESGYVVERRVGSLFAPIATLPANTTLYEDSGLTPETLYAYRVRVLGGAEEKVGGVVSTETPALPAVLVAPVLSAQALSPFTIRLTWSDASLRETQYLVERVTGSASVVVATLGPDTVEFTDEGLQPSTSYQYRVRVTDGTAEKSSGAVVVSTLEEPASLVAPVVSVILLDDYIVQLSWADLSDGESGYLVERDTGSGYEIIAQLSADATGYLDDELARGSSAQYRVSVMGSESAGGSGYRYLRWTITSRRGGTNSVQASEFEVLAEGVPLPIASVSNPLGSSPSRELPANLIDGNVGSKWLDFNFASMTATVIGQSSVLFDLGSVRAVDGYRWYTANDDAARDPVSWTLEASLDATEWTLLDAVETAEVTLVRRALGSSREVDGSGSSVEIHSSGAMSIRSPSPLESWRVAHFGTIEPIGPSADDGDPDGDGWTNLEEYATLQSPVKPQAGLTETGFSSWGGLTFRFERRRGAEVRYRVQGVEGLPSDEWSDLATLEPGSDEWTVHEAGVRIEEFGTGEGRLVKVLDRPATGPRYLRLVVE